MEEIDIVIGCRVKCNRSFTGVPAGTEGVIDEDYGSGVMIAWDLPDQPLPPGYSVYDGKPAIASRILRDGFNKQSELQYLEKIG